KTRTVHNRYYAKTMRNAVRRLRATTDKNEATELYPKVQKMLDKLAKTNIIHRNKAANLKSSLMRHVNGL
ncbi:MAG: 30S ribosomal protein S20, partial [Prevotella sp.]|nr:30S ribosomal protein S20 [Prevotella sp.]